MNAIEINNLTKKFKEKTAVNSISMRIKEGELFSLLGVNGAGKTTTIKMLSGLIKPTSGIVKVLGYRSIDEKRMIRKNINVRNIVFRNTSNVKWCYPEGDHSRVAVARDGHLNVKPSHRARLYLRT